MPHGEKINANDAQKLLTAIPEWIISENGVTLARTIALGDFQDSIVFTNKVAKLAEQENHHPDIFVHNYNNVTLSLSTHSVGGLSEKDFLLAAKIDKLLE